MSTSIFPEVRVTQIRPIAIGNKPIPQMTVGLIGPVFKAITETSTNGYAIEPETAPSIEINLNATTDSQYIDYESMQVQLVVNSTDEVVSLKAKDTDITTVYDVVKSGIEITNSYGYLRNLTVTSTSGSLVVGKTYRISSVLSSDDFTNVGFVTADVPFVATGTTPTTWTNSTVVFNVTDSKGIFYPSTGASAYLGAQKGDWLYRSNGNDVVLLHVNQVSPIKLSNEAFSAPTNSSDAGATLVYTFPDTADLSTVSKNNFLVAIKKSDKSKVYQFGISSVDNSAPGKSVTVYNADKTSDSLIIQANLSEYDWYGYDMPFGSLKLDVPNPYSVPVGLGESTDGSSFKYSILSYNTRIGFDSNYGTGTATTPKSFGRFVNPTSGEYIFLSDKRTNTDLTAVNVGDYLNADNGTNNFKFRITKVGSTVLKSNLNTPTDLTAGDYTFPAGTTFTEITGLENLSYLIATKKTDPEDVYIYKITTITEHLTTPKLTVTNTDFSLDGSGCGNVEVVTADVSSYNWMIVDIPLGSLKVAVSDQSQFTLCAGNYSLNYNFNIINAADFYVSGKTAVTIKNHIADSLGNEIGLADAIFTYRVLETENATQMFNISTQTLRTSICGDISNYNPLGLAAGLLEINTAYTYKVIPTDIAYSERDPDNPKSYIGAYTPGAENTNYHNVANLDWLGTKEVLNSIKESQAPYYLVPLTNDSSTLGMFSSAVLALSDPGKKKEMVLFATTTLPTTETVLGNINPTQADFSIVAGKLRYKPTTKYVSETQPSVAIQFLGIGAKKGDYVSYYNTNNEEQLLKIDNIYPSYFDLGTTDFETVGDLFADIDTDIKFTIKKVYSNKSDVASALVRKAAGYNSFRVKLIWGGDYVDVSIGGVSFTSLPAYYAAAAYAGMANNNGTVVPKTERTINGISKVYNVTPYFSSDDLEVIGSGYVDILNQEFDGAPVSSMRQFMTDGSELSGVEPVDEYAKYLRQLFRPLLGKNNITNALFDVLGIALTTSIETFKPSRFQNIQIVEGMKVSGANKDRISLKLRPTTYKPFNGLDVEIQL